jgi:DNA topoisomerase I
MEEGRCFFIALFSFSKQYSIIAHACCKIVAVKRIKRMAKNLLIVESPAKAKTIEKILGSDFEVKSCYGHIRDLKKEDMGIDINNGFKPNYEISDDKQKVVKELKSLSKKADVWLATDEDREGEAISWHLCEVLGLDPYTTKRIVFHEITKPAILKAVNNPRFVNMNLVNAQQARRILDRIVGFELSPVLWRKMSMRNNLSAGRVQSVAVRLIVEREREINHFDITSNFKIEAFFSAEDINKKKVTFKAEGPEKLKDAGGASSFLEKCKGATYTVKDVQVKPAKKSPSAPFTTSTLQQEASRKLGYSVSKTMLLAQKLYENGHITYMRTDSVNLSDTALESARDAIFNQYGNKYHQQRVFKNKNESAQEAHEAIRPTDMNVTAAGDADTSRLYELIWKRTMASQMADAQLERTIAKIGISTQPDTMLTATGEVMRFDGFLKVYTEGKDDEDGEDENEGMLPPLVAGQQPGLQRMMATERFSRPLPRYTEASLVKKLEELGIGRPSTYAPTISTILARGYVEKRDKEGVKREYLVFTLQNDAVQKSQEFENFGAEKSKLFPTDLGMVVTDFLREHFSKVMDYDFTARIEAEFDHIADGSQQWNKMIDDFYHPFHENVEHTIETASRAKGERELGVDPTSGKPVVARLGRFGPMVQIGLAETEEKPRFAKLRTNQSIETISLEEALELFRLPRNIGQFEEEDVVVNIGRFGPYAQHSGLFYSLKKEMDPYTVALDEVAPLIVEKRKAKAESEIKVFEKEKIRILRGPYGPYIKQGLRNYKIPKEQSEKPELLTIEDIKVIIEEAKANPPKKAPKRKK